MTLSTKVLVQQPHGLHLRAAVQLILVSRQFKSRITLKNMKAVANAQSILGILNLEAAEGSELEIILEGEDAGEALAEVRGFFNSPNSWR
ncbi:MAG TPA: HPr family phosphocarrier protein [bacterium]|nr:HPr family phosphocarrier protein [bacterium]